MADTIKKADNAKKNTEKVKLPKLRGHNAEQTEFFSINDRRYLVRRGEYVEVPAEVAEVVHNAEKAEEERYKYIDELEKAKEDKEKEIGL